MNCRSGVELAGASDVGCLREKNEDSYSYWEPAQDEEFQSKGRLMLVADGMGGHEGGEEASRIAVDVVQHAYASALDEDPASALGNAFQTAHREIQLQAAEEPRLHGMGTTCTAAVLLGHELYYAHVGDSRLYLVHGGEIQQLTRDQTYVGRLIEQGLLDPQDAERHPQRHVLMAALGAGMQIVPELPEGPVLLAKGDAVVLCTDGLWGLVPEAEIRSIVAENAPGDACRKLVERARERGGPDNITVQVLRIGTEEQVIDVP